MLTCLQCEYQQQQQQQEQQQLQPNDCLVIAQLISSAKKLKRKVKFKLPSLVHFVECKM